MKAVFCLTISLLTYLFPNIKSLRNLCIVLSQKAYIIAKNNENDMESLPVKVFDSE